MRRVSASRTKACCPKHITMLPPADSLSALLRHTAKRGSISILSARVIRASKGGEYVRCLEIPAKHQPFLSIRYLVTGNVGLPCVLKQFSVEALFSHKLTHTVVIRHQGVQKQSRMAAANIPNFARHVETTCITYGCRLIIGKIRCPLGQFPVRDMSLSSLKKMILRFPFG